MFNAREVLLEVWNSNCVKADMDRNPITGTEHDGLCEYCDKVLTKENLVEGDLGFYCSDGCLEESESDSFFDKREDFHADG